jgi:hypothetical protein
VDNLITNKSLRNFEASTRILEMHSVKICVPANTKKSLKILRDSMPIWGWLPRQLRVHLA